MMDKKAMMLEMLQADFARLMNQEPKEFAKALQEGKDDTVIYMHALISQMSSSGTLLVKTPKFPKTRNTRVTTIREKDELDFVENSLYTNTSGSSSSRDMILETSDLRPVRPKRGASVKATEIIRQQCASLNTKVGRPGRESDVSLPNRVIRETRSKRPKKLLASSEDEGIRASKRIIVESNEVNQSIGSEKQKRGSVKRKLEEQNQNLNVTRTSAQSRQKTSLFLDDEPVAKIANYSKSSPQKNEKYIQTLERISEGSTDSERTTRSSTNSLMNAQSNKYKANDIINETEDTSNADETAASMNEDTIGKRLPIMNSTMNNQNSIMTSDRIMNATIRLEPLLAKKVFDETVTLKKSSFKEPLSRNTSTLKEVQEDNVTQKLATTSSKKKTIQKNAYLKSQYSDLLAEGVSSPERKQYEANEEKTSKQPKRVTRSNNNSLLSDENEILCAPIGKSQQNKDNKRTTAKSVYKQPALFSPYAKDSVKKRLEAFKQAAVSPKEGEDETAGRVTRTKTRVLAEASFSEASAPRVTSKVARKSLAKADKIFLAKHAREQNDLKENDNTNIPKSTKKATNLMEKATQKSQTKSTPLGKNRMLQLPSSLSKNQHTTPSNAPTHNAYSFIQPMKSGSKTVDRAAEEKRRKAHEDAQRKREENLKAQAEEKRRKREEKELKNKLAREAKEKLDYEKRLRAEREKEEKAKLAQQEREKQKEEVEKKRVAQMQRAMEKEERRKQEESLRRQRLQTQEEQERQLAEQKRREEEMEKRKQIKRKAQMDKAALQDKAKAAQKAPPTSYPIDSDPDEAESHDENEPEHRIPAWESKNTLQAQLGVQIWILENWSNALLFPRHGNARPVRFGELRRDTPWWTLLHHRVLKS